MSDMTINQARAAVDAARNKSAEIDTKMNIAIVDGGGSLKAFLRMDGAWLGSIDIAIKKARTARYFDMNTGEIGKLSQPGGALFNIEHSNDGPDHLPPAGYQSGRGTRSSERSESPAVRSRTTTRWPQPAPRRSPDIRGAVPELLQGVEAARSLAMTDPITRLNAALR